MKPSLRDVSLKTRLTVAFAAVVILATVLGAVVFSVVLVSTMKKSAKEKIEETAKVAYTQVEQKTRGLEIYADLIGSDITFGQALSFDSSGGIEQKIEEFVQLSHANVVAFVPRPEQYVQIRDRVFVNSGNEALAPHLKTLEPIQKSIAQTESETRKGWLSFGGTIYLLAMKPVFHFGTNMGVIVLALRTNDDLAKAIASATGADITIFDRARVYGSSLQTKEGSLKAWPDQERYAQEKFDRKIVEDIGIDGVSYFAFFSPVRDLGGKAIANMAIHVSNAVIREARNRTLTQVLIVTLLATLLSAGIGYLLARAISTPLQQITNGILAIIDRGDLGIRVPGQFGAEMGILTRSFNRLLAQLQDAHEKLAASEQRMKQELTMASTVQEMLFPEREIHLESIELASYIESSSETGGDWFGYSQDRVGKNVSVMIGDVTGHGMPAALITAIANGFFKGVHEAEDMVRQVLREINQQTILHEREEMFSSLLDQFRKKRPLSTADLLTILNQMILSSTKGSLLMTFFASVFDPDQFELRYANAGHNRPLLCHPGSNGQVNIGILPSPASHRLGETTDLIFEETLMKVQQGDVVIWYTDGILECESPAGEMYGKRRLINVLRKETQSSAQQIRDAVIEDAYRFFANHPRKDDITLVVGKIVARD